MEERKLYKLTRVEGEYAYLLDEKGEELFVSLMLLPPNADVGSTLAYDYSGFELI